MTVQVAHGFVPAYAHCAEAEKGPSRSRCDPFGYDGAGDLPLSRRTYDSAKLLDEQLVWVYMLGEL